MVAIQVTGSIVPTNATAVVLNVTATAPSGPGVVTAFPAGGTVPTASTASNLNYVKGQTVPNLVTVPIGAGGKVDLINISTQGSKLDLLADVSAYYAPTTGTPPGGFGALTPARLLDTRVGTGAAKGAVAAGHSVSFPVDGRGGVPASGVSAVVLNVTVTAPTGPGVITAYASGAAVPTATTASNLNYVKAQTVPNLVVAPVGANGQVSLVNISSQHSSVQLVADVAGYFIGGVPTAVGTFGSVSPARLLDTRAATEVGGIRGPIAAGRSVSFQVDGKGGVPASDVSAVVLNVTVTGPTGPGVITAYASGAAVPTATTASNLNYVKAQTVPNLVVAPVGADGQVSLVNISSQHSSVNLIADVAGYYRTTAVTAPTASTSRYVRDIAPGNTDLQNAAIMNAHGQTDAQANASTGSHLTLLQIGAQTLTSLPAPGGVALSATNPTVRLTYAQLVAALEGYLAGYQANKTAGDVATVAIGTNNDGDWATYTAGPRGRDWALQVINPLRTYAATHAPGITIVAADDIESGFTSTEVQAETWITQFFANSSANLIYNGSADGCPTGVSAVNQACAFGWTQLQYFRMAYYLSPARITALPQIYNTAQAMQWANIALTGTTYAAMKFAGALTSYSACTTSGSCSSLTAPQGWAALKYALSTNAFTVNDAVPLSTDLRIDN
jgi:hypothetical protein